MDRPQGAERATREAARHPAFHGLARLGLVARGAIYVIIGILAIQIAVHGSHRAADQRGAMETVDRQPAGHGLLIVLAVGLAGYAMWRIVQAWLGHGPEGGGGGSAGARLAALASGVAYLALCGLAVSILAGTSSSSSSSPHRSAAGVLGWPAGRYLVGIAGLVIIGVGLGQGYLGLTRKFLEQDRTEEMGEASTRFITGLGMVGHLARMVAFVLIGIFAIKAAVDFNSKQAVGLDGALAKIAHQPYGPYLLVLVAAGLIAFGLFSIAEARYRRI